MIMVESSEKFSRIVHYCAFGNSYVTLYRTLLQHLVFECLSSLPHWKISLGAFLIMVLVRAVSVYPGILNKRLFDEVLAPPTGVESSGFSGLVTIVLMMIGMIN